MPLKLITPPSIYPITEDEAQEHLRMSDDELIAQPNLMGRLIAGAVQFTEEYTWRSLITQAWDYYLDTWPAERFIRLPKPPLQEVTGVYYTPLDDDEQEFTGFSVDTVSEPGRIVLDYGESWPSDTLETVNGIRIEFVCGFGDDAEDVPASIIQAMLLHTTQQYTGVNMQKAIEALLYNQRVLRF
jgi:uncharacterized phiE125 gp8 family phage protein